MWIKGRKTVTSNELDIGVDIEVDIKVDIEVDIEETRGSAPAVCTTWMMT